VAKKKSHEEEIRRGLEKLRQSGLALEDSSSNVIAQLQQQIGNEGETNLAVAFSLGKIVDPQAVDALIQIEKQTTDKELKKEIRRSLFKLTQRGLALPREESSETKPRAALFSPSPEAEGYMSSVDGAGGRLIWIVKPQPSHGLQVIQAMVNDREGLQRIGGAQIRRKELRKMAQDIKEEHGISMISVPWEYADEMLYEAYETAKSLGRGGLEEFHEIRGAVNTAKPKPQGHPIYGKLNAAQVQEGAWRELSRRLLEEPELQYWILDQDWAEPFLGQLQEAQSSRLVLNPVQKEERLAAIVRDAVKTICAGDMGKRMQRRMEDTALYFAMTDREESAKLALAVALQIGQGDPGPLDISFLTGLVQKTFAFYLSQQKSKAAEELSLILKP
jgi:hypothetical protein